MTDLQKAGVGKRIMAAIFDGILVVTLAVGLAALLSLCFGYDVEVDRYASILSGYEEQYEVDIEAATTDMTAAELEAHNKKLEAVQTALYQNAEFMTLYTKLTNMQLLMLTFSPLGALLLLELMIPLLLGNGQTIGKKIFGIGLMHIEGIRVTGKQVFIRAILGKYSVELMLPVYIAMMTFTGGLGIVGLVLLAVLLIAQIVCVIITRTNALIHDIFASTVAVDLSSQRIFEDIEDRDNYIKALHAEQAARAVY